MNKGIIRVLSSFILSGLIVSFGAFCPDDSAVMCGVAEAVVPDLPGRNVIRRQATDMDILLNDSAAKNDRSMAERAIANGAIINQVYNNNTALGRAALKGHQEMVEFLLDNGADIEGWYFYDGYERNEKKTYWYILNCPWTMVQFFLDRGVNPHLKTDTNINLLHRYLIATFWEHIDDVGQFQYLLSLGINIEEKMRYGDCSGVVSPGTTPLYAACELGRLEEARLLLEAGADPNTKDDMGRSVLKRCTSRGDKEVVKLLMEYGAR